MSPNDQGDVVDGQEVTSRRNVLVGGASLAVLAWAAPGMTRLSSAYAAGTTCDEPTNIDNPFTTSQNIFLDPGTYEFQVWGGGGGGADVTTVAGGGGGGGYSVQQVTLTTCTEIALVVGQGGDPGNPGGISSVNDPVSVSAGGGDPGVGADAGLGGEGNTEDGDSGIAGDGQNGGAGGAGGGPGGAGGGGGGPGNQDAAAGLAPGGGGGGGGSQANSASAAGARGEIRVTLVPPAP